MALKFNIDSLEGLDESLHSVYREDNGKYILDVEGARAEGDFLKLKGVVDNERKQSKATKDMLATWESRLPGKTPDEIAALLERIPLLEAESQGKIDTRKHQEIIETTVKQRIAPLEHEITKKNQTVAELSQTIEQYKTAERRRVIHDAVRSVAAKEGFQEQTYAGPEGALMLLAERHLTINENGDVVVHEDSKFLTGGLPVREALGEIKLHHSYMLKQSLGGGAAGGAPGTAGTGANPFRSNDLSARMRFMRENERFPEKIEAAVKQAGLSKATEMHKPK